MNPSRAREVFAATRGFGLSSASIEGDIANQVLRDHGRERPAGALIDASVRLDRGGGHKVISTTVRPRPCPPPRFHSRH